jgi:hypothetical protein
MTDALAARLANALHEAGIGCKPNVPHCRASHRGHGERLAERLGPLLTPEQAAEQARLAAIGAAWSLHHSVIGVTVNRIGPDFGKRRCRCGAVECSESAAIAAALGDREATPDTGQEDRTDG